jgi:hypothetical protein
MYYVCELKILTYRLNAKLEALSPLGERVARPGVFFSRGGSGEGVSCMARSEQTAQPNAPHADWGFYQRLARCILLKTAQWALDCRTEIPPAPEFRQQLATDAYEMIRAARKYARGAYRAARAYSSRRPFGPLCLHRSAVGIELDPAIAACRPIRLIVTSPPYPGVHVLYHRWQVQGRRETPAPFWIASSLDGNGEAHYTFGTRKQLRLDGYFEGVMSALRSIARVSGPDTMVVPCRRGPYFPIN